MNPDAYASTALRIRQTGLNPDRMRTVPSWCDARAGRPKSRTTKVSRRPRRAEDWPSTQPIRLSRLPSVVARPLFHILLASVLCQAALAILDIGWVRFRHARDLRHTHQRDCHKVERQSRKRHAREHEGADGKQHRFGSHRRRKQRDHRRDGARESPIGDERHHDENGERGAEGEDECGIDHRKRLRSDQAGRDERERVERRASLIDRASCERDHSHQGRAVD